jgi:acyl carrier protein
MIRKIETLFSKRKNMQKRKGEAAIYADNLSSVEQKIKAIMAHVFKIDIHDIKDEITADDIAQWTSLEHINFLIKLQSDFDIEFTDSQIVEMLSYEAVVKNVTAAIAAKVDP